MEPEAVVLQLVEEEKVLGEWQQDDGGLDDKEVSRRGRLLERVLGREE